MTAEAAVLRAATQPEPGNGPTRMDHHERFQAVAAAQAARRRYPGPVGEMIAREVEAWAEFGWRLGYGPSALVARLIRELLNLPAPPPAAAEGS